MERGRRRINIITKEVANFTYPATRYSETVAGLKGIEQALMSREQNGVQISSDIALWRNHFVFIHGITEPLMKEGKQKERAVRYRVTYPLRMMQITENIAIKRVFCPRRRKGVSASG